MYTRLQLPSEGPSQTTRFSKFESKIAASVLDISVTLFNAIDSERSTCILTRRLYRAPFLRWYEIERRMLPLVKLSASNQTNPIEWHPKFIRSITHAPRLSVKARRPRWKASQSRCARALEKHIFLNRRRRSEQGNYTSNIQLGALSV